MSAVHSPNVSCPSPSISPVLHMSVPTNLTCNFPLILYIIPQNTKGLLLFWNSGHTNRIPEFRNSGISEFRNSGISEPQSRLLRWVPHLKNDPKIKSNSKVKIERNIENESCSTTWVYPKTVVETYTNHKNSPLGPQKVNNEPKIK